MSDYKNMAKYLLSAGEQMKQILIMELIAQEHIATGKLSESFDVEFTVSGDSLYLRITNSAGYAIKVDEGLSAGTVVGVQALKRWVEAKQARGMMTSIVETTADIIAVRVHNSIKERGTVSPKGFIGNAMDTANAQGLFDGIGRATGLDVDAMVGQGELDATITIIATA